MFNFKITVEIIIKIVMFASNLMISHWAKVTPRCAMASYFKKEQVHFSEETALLPAVQNTRTTKRTERFK